MQRSNYSNGRRKCEEVTTQVQSKESEDKIDFYRNWKLKWKESLEDGGEVSTSPAPLARNQNNNKIYIARHKYPYPFSIFQWEFDNQTVVWVSKYPIPINKWGLFRKLCFALYWLISSITPLNFEELTTHPVSFLLGWVSIRVRYHTYSIIRIILCILAPIIAYSPGCECTSRF